MLPMRKNITHHDHVSVVPTTNHSATHTSYSPNWQKPFNMNVYSAVRVKASGQGCRPSRTRTLCITLQQECIQAGGLH